MRNKLVNTQRLLERRATRDEKRAAAVNGTITRASRRHEEQRGAVSFIRHNPRYTHVATQRSRDEVSDGKARQRNKANER